MKAGRKLDAEIAEKVMGQKIAWRWCEKDYGTDGAYDVEDVYDNSESAYSLEALEKRIEAGYVERLPCARNYREDGSFFYYEDLSRYSTKIADAEKVIEKLVELGYAIEVSWLREGGAVAGATDALTGVTTNTEATAPLAICSVALLAFDMRT